MPLNLSRRCAGIAPSATLSIDARAKALKARGVPVVGFGAGEPDLSTPEFICEAARRAIALGHTRYTPVGGTLALRRAVCGKLLRDNGLPYTPEEIIITNGAKHALFGAFSALLDPGDEVLLPSPCWISYPEMIRMAGGVPVFVPAREADGYLPDPADLAARVTLRTKAILVNSPANPTGCVYPEALLREIAALAIRRQLYIISDEIYEKLVYGGARHVSIAKVSEEARAQTMVINGLSKTFAMTGWRVGYAAANESIIRAMTAFQSHSTSCPNAIAQYAAAEALGNGETFIREMQREYDARRRLMMGLIREIPLVSAVEPEGAFYVLLNCRALMGRAFKGRVIDGATAFSEMLLEEAGVAVVPGDAFDAPGCCRLSYAIGREDITRGMAAIRSFVEALEKPMRRAV